MSLLLCFCFLLLPAASAVGTLYIGFLSSEPDWAIPRSLSLEWHSAFQVAVEVLNSEADPPFRLEGLWEGCSCEWTSAQKAASKLVQESKSKGGLLVGVVGPACSEAAAAAAKALQDLQIPLISFAATAARLSRRDLYPNFFRTVLSDDHQASAIAATINQLQATNITVVYTGDSYSLPLAQQIHLLCGGNVFRMELLELETGENVNLRQVEGMFNTIEPYSFLVLAIQPSVATKLWDTVLQLGKSSYPWWYLGSDGVTAVEIQAGHGRLEGEIGIAPYGGDTSDEQLCLKFYDHWSGKADLYPGYSSNRSTSYVPYLIDAVTSLYAAVYVIAQADADGIAAVNSSRVLAALQSRVTTHKGCTGSVEFDPNTGSRITPVYDLVSFSSSVNTWQLKGRIVNGSFASMQPVARPGTFPADGSSTQVYYYSAEHKKGKKVNKALVAAILVFSVAFILVTVSLICYHRLRQNSPLAFFRMKRSGEPQS